MAQHLFPLFGEYDDDMAIARAAGNQGGVTCLPQLSSSLAAGLWSLGLDVNAGTGFWAWRTAWDAQKGSFTIVEDAYVPFLSGVTAPAAGQSRNVLLVGWWKWVAGQIGSDGKPLGTFITAQQAVYTAISGADSATPADPTVPAVDGYGRKSVVLARVVLTNTTATIQWLPRTRLDLAEMGADIDSRMKRVGDEAHQGKLSVDTAPVNPNDVVRLTDVQNSFAHSYANSQSLYADTTTNYPEASGTPVPVRTVAASGINVTNTNGNLVAQQQGYYAVDFTFKQHGSPISAGYLTGMAAVKLASNPAAGFSTEVFHDHDFFGSGKSEAIVSGALLVPMEVGDTLGFFQTSDSYGDVALWARVTYLGSPAPTSVLTILSNSQTITESPGQTYPASIAFGLTAANAQGTVTWSIDAAGAGQIDGTTDPAATIVSGNQLQIAWTAAPSPLPKSWDVKLRAVDASGAIATKTITITLQAVQPLAITTPDQFVSGYSTDYPLAVTFQATSTGGVGTITYTVVADANTTLPSAAISGTTVTGSATAGGTYKVHLHAVDSSTPTAQTADLVVNITATVLSSGGGGGTGCFVPGTEVLMADGSAKPIEQVEVGDVLLTIGAEDHQSGLTTVRETVVEATLPYREQVKLISVAGTIGTDYHRYATLIPEEGARMWTQARHLAAGLELRGVGEDHRPIVIIKPTILEAGTTNEVYNLRTDLLSFLVRGGPGRPWLLVHNMKIQTLY